jgi:hypothetical protein
MYVIRLAVVIGLALVLPFMLDWSSYLIFVLLNNYAMV